MNIRINPKDTLGNKDQNLMKEKRNNRNDQESWSWLLEKQKLTKFTDKDNDRWTQKKHLEWKEDREMLQVF